MKPFTLLLEGIEARGQRDFVASESLPIKHNSCTVDQLESIGIVFGEPIDNLFVAVQLPDGWEKVSTDHSMWSELVDERGRKRASIFYKAAFYDRDASISLTRRFSCSRMGDLDYKKHEWHCVVTDCEDVVWTSDERVEPEPKILTTFH